MTEKREVVVHKPSYLNTRNRDLQNEKTAGAGIRAEWKVPDLLYTFCLALLSFEFSRNVLLTNFRKPRTTESILLREEALFCSPLGRENHIELEGIPG